MKSRQTSAVRWLPGLLVGAVCFGGWIVPTHAQQITTTTPLVGATTGYQEHFSVGGAIQGPNFFARWGTANGMPAGGGGGVAAGGGWQVGDLSGQLNFAAGQSSTRGVSSVSPTLTTLDGYPGHFFSGQVSPFVMGVVPVVGAGQFVAAPRGVVPWQAQWAEAQYLQQTAQQAAARLEAADVPVEQQPDAQGAAPRLGVPAAAAQPLNLNPATIDAELQQLRAPR